MTIYNFPEEMYSVRDEIVTENTARTTYGGISGTTDAYLDNLNRGISETGTTSENRENGLIEELGINDLTIQEDEYNEFLNADSFYNMIKSLDERLKAKKYTKTELNNKCYKKVKRYKLIL